MDCLVDLCMFLFFFAFDFRFSCSPFVLLDFVYDHCIVSFWLWLLPGPFWFVCNLDFDTCIRFWFLPSPYDLFTPVPNSFSTVFDHLTVILFWPSDMFCYFSFVVLKVILGGDLISVGGWLYATSSPVSLWRLAEVHLALLRQIGLELLIGLWCYFFVSTPFYIPFPILYPVTAWPETRS